MEKDTREHLALSVSALSFFVAISSATLTYFGVDTPYKTLVYNSQLESSSSLISNYLRSISAARQIISLEQEISERILDIRQQIDKSERVSAELKDADERYQLLLKRYDLFLQQAALFYDASVKIDLIGSDILKRENYTQRTDVNDVNKFIAGYFSLSHNASLAISNHDRKALSLACDALNKWMQKSKEMTSRLDADMGRSTTITGEISAYFNAGKFSIGNDQAAVAYVSPGLPGQPSSTDLHQLVIENGVASASDSARAGLPSKQK